MRKFVHSFARIIRGGTSPWEVSLAVFLGLLAGFLTGCNASLAIVLLAVLLSNASTRVFLQCLVFGVALSWGLTPVTCHLGYLLLERTALGALIGPHADNLAVILFDLERYTLAGGAALATVLALPAALAAARVAQHLQTTCQQGNHRAPNATQRALSWLICGRPVPPLAVNAPRWFRPLGPPVLMAATCSLALLVWFGGPQLAGRLLLARLSVANQAQVDAASVRLSLADGLVEISDLRLADPDHLDRDRLRIGNVTAMINPAALVRGRVEVERLLLEGLESDLPRATRARPYDVALAGFAADAPSASSEPADLGALPLADCLHDWPALAPRVACLRDLIIHLERLAVREGSADNGDSGPGGYVPPGFTALRQLRCDFGRLRQPRIVVHALRAKGLPPSWGLGDGAVLELCDVSSNPALVGRPTKLSITSTELAAELSAELDLKRGQGRHAVKLHAANLDLAQALGKSQPACGMVIQAGRLSVTGHGWLTRQRLELPLEVEAADLRLEMDAAQRPEGLTDKIWNSGRHHLSRFVASAVVAGAWDSPRVRFDLPGLVDQYKAALLADARSAPSAPPFAETPVRRPAGTTPAPATASVQADNAVLTPIDPVAEGNPAASDSASRLPAADHATGTPEVDAPRAGRYASRYSPAAAVSAAEVETSPATTAEAPGDWARAQVADELRYPGLSGVESKDTWAEHPAMHQAQAPSPQEIANPYRSTVRVPVSRVGAVEAASSTTVARQLAPAGSTQQPPPIGFNIGYDSEPAVSEQAAASPTMCAPSPEPKVPATRPTGPDESVWPWNVPDRVPSSGSRAEMSLATATDQSPQPVAAYEPVQVPADKPVRVPADKTAQVPTDEPAQVPTDEPPSSSGLARWSQSVKRGFGWLIGDPSNSTEDAADPEAEENRGQAPQPPWLARRPQVQASAQPSAVPHDEESDSRPESFWGGAQDDTDAAQVGPELEEPAAWYQFWR